MRRSSTSRSVMSAIVAVALVAVLAVMAGVAASGDPTPSPSGGPSTPSASPSTPSASPSLPASPSPAPSDGAGIPLDIATPHDVSVIVDDETGTVGKVASGRAGDGMSVRWFDVAVENIDADTIEVTWVGLPQDDVVRLTVAEQDGTIELRFVQASPPLNSDALGHDRVLVIDFAEPVDARDIVATVQETTDTQD